MSRAWIAPIAGSCRPPGTGPCMESRVGVALTRITEILRISPGGRRENSRPPALDASGDVYPAISHQCHISLRSEESMLSTGRWCRLYRSLFKLRGASPRNFGGTGERGKLAESVSGSEPATTLLHSFAQRLDHRFLAPPTRCSVSQWLLLSGGQT